MRTLSSLAVVLVVFGGELRAAPVPADKPPPSIDGKYTLVSVSTPDDRGGAAGGGAVIGGPGGGVMRVRPGLLATYMTGPATITKNQITIEGRGGTISPFAATGVTLPVTMEYTIDATKNPMTIDVDHISMRGKKTKALGLVEVVGDRVIIAINKEGGERPKSTEEVDDVTVYYFLKAPPPPKVEFRIVAMTAGKEEDAEKELNKLTKEGYELVNTTNPIATDGKASPTIIHFVLKRTTK